MKKLCYAMIATLILGQLLLFLGSKSHHSVAAKMTHSLSVAMANSGDVSQK